MRHFSVEIKLISLLRRQPEAIPFWTTSPQTGNLSRYGQGSLCTKVTSPAQ